MSTEVRVPTLPESVSDATVLTWHKQPGEAIARDENLVDLETDKVVLEVPSPVAGVLKEQAVEAGAVVTADELLALVEAGLERGARNLTLEVRMNNQPARDLYQRFGFAPVGLRKNYYRTDDALVMSTYIGAVSFEWAAHTDEHPRSAHMGQMGDVIGMAIGLALAAGFSQLLGTVLFQVDARDPMVFAVTVAALLLAGVAACFVPALRAARVDPLVALRNE